MSERKTAEIKSRCTPSFKASLAASADEAGESMSEYIEIAVASRQNTKLESERIVPMVVKQDWSKFASSGGGTHKRIAVGTVTSNGPAKEGDIVRDRMTGEGYRATAAVPECSPGGKAACVYPECSGGDTCSPRSDSGPITFGEVVAIGSDGVFVGSAEEFTDHVADLRNDAAPCACKPWEFCSHKASA